MKNQHFFSGKDIVKRMKETIYRLKKKYFTAFFFLFF